jgi:hypothetical protein
MDKLRKIALLVTSIPMTLFAIVILVFGLLNKETQATTEGLTAVDISLQVLLGLIVMALLSSIFLAVKRKQEIAKGISLGSAFGFVLWIIVFVVLSAFYEG